VAPLSIAQIATPTGAPSSVRLFVLEGGVLASDPARYRLTNDEVETTALSIAAYLIVHPRGVLLWDAAAVADGERVSSAAGAEQRLVRTDRQERFVTLGPPLAAQLAASGFVPADVTHLALSHYHWDHTANANAFAHATWLVREIERDLMFAAEPPGGTRPATYTSLKDSRTIFLTADEYDVFGDGTVVVKVTPGHTEGHQVLYLQLAKTGGIVLSGDLYHYPEERTLDRLPTGDVDQALTNSARVELDAFLARTGAKLWIQHDLVAHRKLKKAPEYYD
jgi:glyoxylase-like metal-dependent hydrolase (beta-lactamase superfamily II)